MTAPGVKTDQEIRSIAQEVADKHLEPNVEEHDKTGELPLENLLELTSRPTAQAAGP